MNNRSPTNPLSRRAKSQALKRRLDKTEDMNRDNAVGLFSWLVIMTLLGFLLGFTLSMWGSPPGLNIAVQTYVPLFTAFLQAGSLLYIGIQVSESLNDRKTMIEENAKERRVRHLEKQLLFYSKVVNGLSKDRSLEDDGFEKIYTEFKEFMDEIKDEFLMWGTNVFTAKIDVFFHQMYDRNMLLDHFTETEVFWYIVGVIQEAVNDYNRLSREYRELTSIQNEI